MSAPSIGEELFTTTQHGTTVLYQVDGNTVAVAMPSAPPWNPQAWHVTLVDPFTGDLAGGDAANEQCARRTAELFARTAARAVTR